MLDLGGAIKTRSVGLGFGTRRILVEKSASWRSDEAVG
jgi:hypothetical protein